MKVGISTESYDLDGAKILNNLADTDIKNNQGERRMSKTATLDGGATVYDTGYSAADRKYIVQVIDDDGSIAVWAERIVKNYSFITLSTKYGIF